MSRSIMCLRFVGGGSPSETGARKFGRCTVALCTAAAHHAGSRLVEAVLEWGVAGAADDKSQTG